MSAALLGLALCFVFPALLASCDVQVDRQNCRVEDPTAREGCALPDRCTPSGPPLSKGACRGQFDCPSGTECIAGPAEGCSIDECCHSLDCTSLQGLPAFAQRSASTSTSSGPPVAGAGGSTSEAQGCGGGEADPGEGGSGGGGEDQAPAGCVPKAVEPRGVASQAYCSIPRASAFDRHVLIDGFGVGELKLDEASTASASTPLSFTWRAPEETTVVICGVFRTPPSIVARVEGDTSSPESARRAIVDPERSLLVLQEFPGPEGTVVPSEMFATSDRLGEECDLRAICPGTRGSCANSVVSSVPGDLEWPDFASRCPITTRLLLGCWSYDTHALTGASLLYSLDASQVASYCGFLAPDVTTCSAENRGQSCVLAGEGQRFGVCWSTASDASLACRATCVTDLDCEGIPGVEALCDLSTKRGIAPGGSVESLVGLCKEVPP